MDRRSFLKTSALVTSGARVAAWLANPDLTANAAESQRALPDEGPLPDLGGAVAWLNSAPLSDKLLRGKVVLVNFWTYSCINSLRPLPYVKSWAAKYLDAGLVVIGVHTPEFSFEKERTNVEQALQDLKVTYPVAMDSDYRIWQSFNNQYWPAFYFIDGKERIRYHHFGEGEYSESERVIQELLKENGATGLGDSIVSTSASGVEAAPGLDVQSPETYIGYRQAERFASPERQAHDARKTGQSWSESLSRRTNDSARVGRTKYTEIKLEFYLRSESENNGSARSPSWVLVILNDGLQKQDRRHLKETVELETVFGFP